MVAALEQGVWQEVGSDKVCFREHACTNLNQSHSETTLIPNTGLPVSDSSLLRFKLSFEKIGIFENQLAYIYFS